MKYICVTINNARAYHEIDRNGRTYTQKDEKKDFSLNFLRKSSVLFGTLHRSTVENILRVLCGLRPIPAREVSDDINDIAKNEIFKSNSLVKDTASQTLVRIKNGIQWHDKKKEYVYIPENRIKRYTYDNAKMKWSNSFIDLENPNNFAYSHLTWERMSDWLSTEALFGDFCLLLSELSKIALSELSNTNLVDVMLLAFQQTEKSKDKMIEMHGEKMPTAIINLIYKGKTDFALRIYDCKSRNECPQDVGIKGVERVSCRSFELYIPYSDELRSMLENGCGFATCLDGGFVRIGIKKDDGDYCTITDELPKDCKSVA